MTDRKWKKGDIVQLRSGGPLMTIGNPEELVNPVRVFTSWFDSTYAAHSGYFHPETLLLVEMREP